MQEAIATHPDIALWDSFDPETEAGVETFESSAAILSKLPASQTLLDIARVGSIGSLHAHVRLLNDWLTANGQSLSTGEADIDRITALTTLAASLQRQSAPAATAINSSFSSQGTELPLGTQMQHPLLVALEADAVLHDDFVPRMQTLLMQLRSQYFDGVNLWMPNWFCNKKKQYIGPAKLVWPSSQFQKGVLLANLKVLCSVC